MQWSAPGVTQVKPGFEPGVLTPKRKLFLVFHMNHSIPHESLFIKLWGMGLYFFFFFFLVYLFEVTPLLLYLGPSPGRCVLRRLLWMMMVNFAQLYPFPRDLLGRPSSLAWKCLGFFIFPLSPGGPQLITEWNRVQRASRRNIFGVVPYTPEHTPSIS